MIKQKITLLRSYKKNDQRSENAYQFLFEFTFKKEQIAVLQFG
jgi:hypothetical protein